MTELVFKLLSSGLSLWESKEKRKYLDKVIDLKKRWYLEINKDDSDDSVLDSIELELRILAETFSSQVTPQNP